MVLLDWIIVILRLVYVLSLSYLAVEVICFYYFGKFYQLHHLSKSEITCNIIATATESSCRLASRRRDTQAREYCNISFSVYKRKIVSSIKIGYELNYVLLDVNVTGNGKVDHYMLRMHSCSVENHLTSFLFPSCCFTVTKEFTLREVFAMEERNNFSDNK
ncbi:hypothetical protein DINM_005656 [Dirofilaria immitis]|nr:hypothetical protein [Dirofilaria immitis]